MRTKEAVAQRILELCRERNIAVNHIQYAQSKEPESGRGVHQENLRRFGNHCSTIL